MKTFLIGTALTTCLVGQALATQQPNPGRADSRVRNVNYDPANVVELWSTPGAVMVIEFADDEMVADVAASDSHTLKAEPRGNYLFFKFEGCLIPEPVIVLTKLPSGKLRRYALQVETHPQICSNSTPTIVQAAANGDPPAAAQNLKHISADALGPDADVDYSVVFPGINWLAAARRRERQPNDTRRRGPPAS
jgi:type IV secretory pathway VirB9-like protein